MQSLNKIMPFVSFSSRKTGLQKNNPKLMMKGSFRKVFIHGELIQIKATDKWLQEGYL